MRIIDLTHTICETMPVYPGTEPPTLAEANTYEQSGFRETLLRMYSHTGTHMDAPRHIYPDGVALDELPPEAFVGRAIVIDATDVPAGGEIGLEHIDRPRTDEAEFLLFRTDWDRYWGQLEYFGEYPVLSAEAVDYLVQSGKKGVGLDTIGLDPIADEKLTRHHRLLHSGERIILENLCRLRLLGDRPFLLAALPLKYRDADGAPTRAIALLD